MNNKIYLAVEFTLLCLLIPAIILFYSLANYMFIFLWSVALYCVFIYRRFFYVNWKTVWKWEAVNWSNLKPILIRWAISSFAMVLIIIFYDGEKLFHIFHHRPEIIPILIFVYPILSALPQEFIFCSFFFKRYQVFFGKDKMMIVVSALVFAWAHVLYINPIAPVVSLFGGLIFAHTFYKSRSLALITLEHGLYGNSLFLSGLGYYFFSGAVAG